MRRDQREIALLAAVGLTLAVCCRSPRPDATADSRSFATARSSTPVSIAPPVMDNPSVAQLITDTAIVTRQGVEGGELELFYNAKGVLVATREWGGPLSYEVSRPYTAASARRDK